MGNVVTCCKICPKISLDRTRQDDTISLLSNEPSASWSPVLSFHSAPEPVSKMGQTVPPLESCCAASSESGGSGARMPDVVQSVGTPTSILGRNLNPFACCNPLLQGIGQHEADIACAASAAITGTGPSNWTCMVPPSGCQAQWPWVPGDRRETACGIELNPFSLNAMLAVQDWRRTFSGEASGDVGAAGLHTMPPVAGAGEARASVPPLIYDNRLMQLVGEHGFCSGCIEAALCSHCSGSRADGLNLSRAGVPLGLSSNLGMTSGSTEAPCLLAARGTIPASDSVLHGIEPEAQQGYRASLPPGFRSMISDPDAWSDGDRPVDIGQCCGEMGCSCENIVKRVCDVKTRQGFEQTSRSVTGERATSLSDIFSVPQATGKGKRRKKKRRGSSSRKDPGCPTEELPALDAAFPVKISAPGGDNFELQVSWQDLVQDVQQVLMEREETNTRTCFLLHLDGIPLDPFAELRAVEGLSANATLRIVEEPYTMREVRIHLSHVRNLLRGVDQADIYSANDGASPSVVAIVVGESNLTDVPSEGTRRKRKSGNGPETVPDCAPPDYVLPGCKDRPLMPLQPLSRDIKPVHCLKSMRTSTWNPPPGNRRMHGDLLYLDVVTAEDRRASITASTRGFFINQSTGDEFNPRPASPSLLSHSLIDLLNQLSPIFKKSFTALQKRRLQHSPLEQLPTPFPVYCWAVAPMEHLADCMCTDDARSARLGCDDNPVTQTRDWNEEIQATRELQRQNLPERLLRDRTIFKVHSDFVMTAIRGAEAVVDGNVMAINPGEDSRSQMFVWNNLFFSLGFDVRDHYKALGGDAAAHAAPALDLAGVRAFASLDVEAICCLGTTIVDYRGYRVTAQSVVPGILEREQRQAVTYGSLDFGETVQGSRKIVSLLERSSKPLHVLRHKVLNEKDEEVELVSSVECKGIVGNDGRHYILDLLRTFPPDANFLPPLPGEDPLPDDAFPEPCKHFGFPRPYRHRLVSLRPELVEAFTRAKYEDFMKLAIAKHKSQSEGNADGSEEKEIDNREVIRNACNAVGSVSDCFFDIRFNPDVFTPTVRFPESECESVERQKLLHREASAFLLSHQIPAFLKESLDHSAVILDGATLVEFMHRFGINARYLGTVVRALEEQEERDCNRLHFLHRMLVTEVIVRAAKHLFRTYLQPVEMSTLSVAVAHFLNCFLSSCPSPGTHLATLDEGSASRNRRRSKRRGGGRGAPGAESTSWAQLTPGDLWKNLAVEAQERYSFLITSEGIDQAVEKFGLQKITLLRELCIKGGIQLLLREYVLDGRQKPAFGEEDIENLFPVAKHLWPPACDAQHLLQSAQARIQQGFLKDACDQTAEALNLYNNIFGALHPDICACLRVFARLNFILGNQAEAMIHQEKALIMSERVLGLDNPYTIQDYVICALFAFTNAQVAKALKLLYRARYLALIVCSEDHPQIATIDSNIGLMLTAVEEHDTAQRFLDKALTLNTKHCGEMSLKVALSHHFLARSYAAKGDFRSALKHEKETYTVYNEQFGKMHEKTEASYTYLQQLTDQAVVLQRNVNEICKNGSKPSIQPMQIPAPNMPYILEMLNAINGIVLPTLSCEDLQKLKAEVKELEDMINQEPPPLDVEALIAETANQEESPAGQES